MQTKFGRLFGCRLNLVHSRLTLVVRCLLTTQFPVQRTPTYHIQPPRNTISRPMMTNIARLAQRQSVRQQLRRAHGSNPGRSGRNQIPRFVLRRDAIFLLGRNSLLFCLSLKKDGHRCNVYLCIVPCAANVYLEMQHAAAARNTNPTDNRLNGHPRPQESQRGCTEGH